MSEQAPSSPYSPETLNMFFQRELWLCVGPREDNRVDRHNFRLLLWKTMAKFPQIVEARSRQVVPLFLEFVRYDLHYKPVFHFNRNVPQQFLLCRSHQFHTTAQETKKYATFRYDTIKVENWLWSCIPKYIYGVSVAQSSEQASFTSEIVGSILATDS